MAKALTAQQRKFKSAVSACKPVLYGSSGKSGPQRKDWNAYGSCMSSELRSGRSRRKKGK